jgi:hypothetical protein
MNEHRRAADDITEPQTIDELVRETHRDVKELKTIVKGNGKPGLCDRVLIQEMILQKHIEEEKNKREGSWRLTDTLLSAGMLIVTLVAVFK